MYLAIDIGGTHTRVAVSKDALTIEKRLEFLTSQDYATGLQNIVEAVHQLSLPMMTKVGVGFPGRIDRRTGRILGAAHLHEWISHNLKDALEQEIKAMVVLDNDANLAALAEANIGAGQGFGRVGYLTLSTGVGGALVINGKLDQATLDSEPGHIIIDPQGKYWPYCEQTGCFESMASGTAFEQTFEIKAEDCKDPEIWEKHAKATSKGLVKIIEIWKPEVLVLGGGLTEVGEMFFSPLQSYTAELVAQMPEIKRAELGEDNVLLGGMLLTKETAA